MRQINQTKLNNVLSGSVSGVTLNDVQKFFALSGSSTNPNVQFLTGSNQTQAAAVFSSCWHSSRLAWFSRLAP